LIIDRAEALVIEINEEVEQGAEVDGKQEEKIHANTTILKTKTNAKSESKNNSKKKKK
jgi:hypothetical protein